MSKPELKTVATEDTIDQATTETPAVEMEATANDDVDLNEAELEAALNEVNEASAETQASTEALQQKVTPPPAPKPKPLTVTQEAVVTTFNEMTDTLNKYDICRAAVERISAEMRDLRIALDAFEPGQLIQTTVANIRIPMTASAVLEAKRVELAQAMDYMRELNARAFERAEAMSEASYLNSAAERAPIIPPRRPLTRGPIITEREPGVEGRSEDEIHRELAEGMNELVQKIHQPPPEDEIPSFLRKPREDEDEPRGLLGRMTQRFTGRNSG